MKFSNIITAFFLTGIFFLNGYGQGIKGDWKLVEMKADGKMFALTDGKTPTLNFDNTNSFFGNAGCNSYRASYKIQKSKINITPGISTKMACVDERANQQESLFLGMFGKLSRYKISGRTFTLYSADKRNVLKFIRYNRIIPL